MTRDGLGRIDLISRGGTTLVNYGYTGQQVKDVTFETGTYDVAGAFAYDGTSRLTRLA